MLCVLPGRQLVEGCLENEGLARKAHPHPNGHPFGHPKTRTSRDPWPCRPDLGVVRDAAMAEDAKQAIQGHTREKGGPEGRIGRWGRGCGRKGDLSKEGKVEERRGGGERRKEKRRRKEGRVTWLPVRLGRPLHDGCLRMGRGIGRLKCAGLRPRDGDMVGARESGGDGTQRSNSRDSRRRAGWRRAGFMVRVCGSEGLRIRRKRNKRI